MFGDRFYQPIVHIEIHFNLLLAISTTRLIGCLTADV